MQITTAYFDVSSTNHKQANSSKALVRFSTPRQAERANGYVSYQHLSNPNERQHRFQI